MTVENNELLNILKEANNKLPIKTDVSLIEHILSIVIMNPLEEDRKRCQEQIKFVINQRVKNK